ncbi:MAG: hypothetical protein OSJ53_15595 [Kineothrix sp.]|nr:hypothetical protein [Kineothrix sp.]
MAAKNKSAAEAAETKQTAEAKQAVETEAPKEPVEEKKEPTRYMYVGPTVPGIGIQNRVYTDIPQEVIEIANNGHPVIRDLFIKIRDYPAAERMIREKKGYLYNAYLAAQKIRMENVKKAEDTFTGDAETEERG